MPHYRVVETIDLTGDPEVDMAAVAAACQGHLGLHPELAAPIVPAPPRSGERKQA